MNEIKSRLNKLLVFDDIRKYKIIEMFQYTLIFFLISLVVATILNKTYYKKVKENNEKIEKARKKTFWGALKLFFILVLETFVLMLIVFYMRKFVRC